MKEPFKSLMERGKAMVSQGKLRDVSIFVVQPWLDIPEIASTVIAISDDEAAAKEAAASLAEELNAIREDMWPELMSVDKIIDLAEANRSGKPVILADSADSPNGGAVGDSPVVALRLQERGSNLKAAMSIRDPESVEQAFQMGVGATAEFCVGGKLTPGLPGPFRAVGTVLGLYENDPIHGKHPRIGKAATVAFGNIQVILCTAGSSSREPEMYRDFGIEPEKQDLIVIKANTSFRAFYKDMTDLIYVADTPGSGASNLRLLDFLHLPQGIYPFNRD
jgi:microcystin degradation protein MlrC